MKIGLGSVKEFNTGLFAYKEDIVSRWVPHNITQAQKQVMAVVRRRRRPSFARYSLYTCGRPPLADSGGGRRDLKIYYQE
ncbi:hypothetical protein EVAR_49286_1 [Eumeta japonica]|uniref:Uncharacterized protein n=1 Tax=Eumeta variegata TaxID=151549 RepID=A0A4C1XMX6_EUMVA|nr:hypothetical protein EVAR_49286_1 [Eumeta japonica]